MNIISQLKELDKDSLRTLYDIITIGYDNICTCEGLCSDCDKRDACNVAVNLLSYVRALSKIKEFEEEV